MGKQSQKQEIAVLKKKLRLYNKHQVFFNLLIFNIIGSVLNAFQWLEIEPERPALIFKYKTVDFFSVLVISEVMTVIYNWAGKQKSYVNIIVFILFSLISPALLLLLSNSIKYVIWPAGILYKFSFETILLAINHALMFFIILGGIFHITRYRIRYIQQKEATLKAETLAKDTQLKMLRYQINPHFLFNILNSLHALIDENKEKAKNLIVNISEYYRFTLKKQLQKHSIDNEIEIIKKYLEIQKVRFEENFEFEIAVDEKAGTFEIPSFVIHLLIENAIKYGLKYYQKKLIVRLNVSIKQESLSITVSNSGKIAKTDNNAHTYWEGTGSGIDNLTNRLKLFFEDNFTFSLYEKDEWVIAKIDINNYRV